MKKYIILTLVVLLQSCYTLKPDSSGLSSKNHNDKQSISQPVLVKKRNPIGITVNIAAPIIAGAAMYEYVDPVVKYQDGSETKGFKPANAAIGILGMLTINKIIDYSMGLNKPADLTEVSVQKWLSKTELNKNYNFITNDNYSSLLMIPKSKESQYVIHNIKDVLEFKRFYPAASTENIGEVINKATSQLSQEDLATLIQTYPSHPNIYQSKVKYVETSRNYDELWSRNRNYPEAKVNLEFLASDLVENADNLLDFINKYGSSSQLSKVKVYSFKNSYSENHLKNITLQNYGTFEIEESTFKQYYKNNSTIVNNYFDALFKKDKVLVMSDLVYFYTVNKWLTHLANANNKLEKAWQVGYHQYANGDDLVYMIKNFHNYDWNLKSNEVNQFVDVKIQELIKSYVSVSNFQLKRSSNEDMDRWISVRRATGIVFSEGVIHYLVYGDVVNKSKFSLPIKIYTTSQLNLKLEGLATLPQKILLTLMTGRIATDAYRPYGDVEETYYLGYLRPHETKKFAVKYDLDAGLEKGIDFGFDIFSIQYAERVRLDKTKFEINQFKGSLDRQTIDKQNDWLTFVHGNLPAVQMIDAYRNISYSTSQGDRDREAEVMLEEWRRAMEKAERESRNKNVISKNENNIDEQIAKTNKQKECENKNKIDFNNFYAKVKIGKWEKCFIDPCEKSWVELFGGGILDLSGRYVTRYKDYYEGEVGNKKMQFSSIKDYLYAVFIKNNCDFITNNKP